MVSLFFPFSPAGWHTLDTLIQVLTWPNLKQFIQKEGKETAVSNNESNAPLSRLWNIVSWFIGQQLQWPKGSVWSHLEWTHFHGSRYFLDYFHVYCYSLQPRRHYLENGLFGDHDDVTVFLIEHIGWSFFMNFGPWDFFQPLLSPREGGRGVKPFHPWQPSPGLCPAGGVNNTPITESPTEKLRKEVKRCEARCEWPTLQSLNTHDWEIWPTCK